MTVCDFPKKKTKCPTGRSVIWDFDASLTTERTGYYKNYRQTLLDIYVKYRGDTSLPAPDGTRMLDVVQDHAEVLEIISHLYKTRGSSYDYFADVLGISAHTLITEVEANLDPAECIYRDPVLLGLFHYFAQSHKYNHVILTHASPDWLNPSLDLLGLGNFFPDDRRLTLDRYGYDNVETDTKPAHLKSDSCKGWHMAAETLGLDVGDYARLAVVEDNLNNLKKAYAAFGPGAYYVFVKHGRTVDVPDFVDAAVDTPAEAFALLKGGEDWRSYVADLQAGNSIRPLLLRHEAPSLLQP